MIGKPRPVPEKHLTTTQAAVEAGVTRQGLVQAIALGRLKAIKIGRNLYVAPTDLLIYKMGKWNREKSKDRHGRLVYDPSEGRYSVRQAARYLEQCLEMPYTITRIYNLIKRGLLKHDRYRCAYIIHKPELERLEIYERARRGL